MPGALAGQGQSTDVVMKRYPVLNVFPAGPLRVHHAGGDSGIRVLLLAAVLALCSFGVLALGLPGIVKDWQIARAPVPVSVGAKGICSNWLVVMNCNITLEYRHQGQRVGKDRIYFFFGIDSRHYDTRVVALDGDPNRMTLKLGIDHLLNRVVFLLSIMGLILSATGWVLRDYRRMWPLIRFGKGRTVPLHPVVVTLPGKATRTYQWLANGKKHVFHTQFSNTELGPFLLGTSDDDSFHALAVVPVGSDIAILLDLALTRIDLTKEQQHAIYQSCGG